MMPNLNFSVPFSGVTSGVTWTGEWERNQAAAVVSDFRQIFEMACLGGVRPSLA